MSVRLVLPPNSAEPGGIILDLPKSGMKFSINPELHKTEVKVKARRSYNGDIVLYEHPEVDVAISTNKTKILVIPKGKVSDDSYDIQDKIFNYLSKRGVVDPASVQSSSAYGILEGKYYQNEDIGVLGLVIYEVNNFIQKDKENYVYDEIFDKMEKEMIDPEDDRTTELGEIPHEEMQGALRPGYIYPYGSYGAMGLYRI